MTTETVLEQLERSGLTQTAGVLRLGPPEGSYLGRVPAASQRYATTLGAGAGGWGADSSPTHGHRTQRHEVPRETQRPAKDGTQASNQLTERLPAASPRHATTLEAGAGGWGADSSPTHEHRTQRHGAVRTTQR